MARIDEKIFGYRQGKVKGEDRAKLVNAFLRLGISSKVDSDGRFTTRERDKARFVAYAKHKLRYELTEPLGLYGFLWRNRRRYGVFLAIILLSCAFFFSSDLVWDVRVSGNERLSDEAVMDALCESGFEIGSSWRTTDKNAVEAELLSNTPDISWISINRRGTVAYVEVIESENVAIEENVSPLYSNIVADRDGVIEEISVKSGSAAVKIGDVVKRGDVLISGVVENENGSYLCRAEGIVRAQSAETVVAEISRDTEERILVRQRIAHVRLILFRFSINIFKNYGKYENSCDIIEKMRDIFAFGEHRLPIRISTTYLCEYEGVTVSRTPDEMITEAKRVLEEKISDSFKDADVVKLRTEGGFDGDYYRLKSRVVYSTDIGTEQEIKTS